MPALLGYVVVTLVTAAIVMRYTDWQRPPSAVRATLDLPDTARKVEAVLSALAGFAFTSIVFLITLSGSRLDVHAEHSIDLIALLVVAYLGFVVGAIMYAHTERVRSRSGVDLLAAQHAVASSQFYRSIVSGWMALGPLIAIVGAPLLTNFVLGLLLLALVGGWIFHAGDLSGLGFADRRFLAAVPVASVVGPLMFAALVQIAPQLRSSASVLFLIAAGAAIGATAHFGFHASRVFGEELPEPIVRRLRFIVAADSHASSVLLSFLWLAVAGVI